MGRKAKTEDMAGPWRGRSGEFGQHAARLRSDPGLQARARPARGATPRTARNQDARVHHARGLVQRSLKLPPRPCCTSDDWDRYILPAMGNRTSRLPAVFARFILLMGVLGLLMQSVQACTLPLQRLVMPSMAGG